MSTLRLSNRKLFKFQIKIKSAICSTRFKLGHSHFNLRQVYLIFVLYVAIGLITVNSSIFSRALITFAFKLTKMRRINC